jgi:hypothetical protein
VCVCAVYVCMYTSITIMWRASGQPLSTRLFRYMLGMYVCLCVFVCSCSVRVCVCVCVCVCAMHVCIYTSPTIMWRSRRQPLSTTLLRYMLGMYVWYVYVCMHVCMCVLLAVGPLARGRYTLGMYVWYVYVCIYLCMYLCEYC